MTEKTSGLLQTHAVMEPDGSGGSVPDARP
jgi:hypothetical protein